MDAFADNFDQAGVAGVAEVDPAAEFLAREKDQLAGLEDELTPASVPAAAPALAAATLPLDAATPVTREEPEKIRKWREDQKQRLAEKDREEELKKEELREQARKELADWYKQHEDTIRKTKASNRNAEKQFVAETDAIEPGTEWERIAKLCDFNPKSNKSSRDVSRMRSIILQLKQNPIAGKA